jgi:hypothetical protein
VSAESDLDAENLPLTMGQTDENGLDSPLSPASDGPVDGRDPATGRFLPGNSAGVGNPLSRRANEFRVKLYGTCSPEDLGEVVSGLIAAAKDREPWAVKLLLDRLLGPPIALDVATRIERLEILLQERASL